MMMFFFFKINSSSANPTKWSNILKNSLAVADEFLECILPLVGVYAERVK